ncbi:MAG: SIS domain-containing protein [Vicinamibacteria bacterium]
MDEATLIQAVEQSLALKRRFFSENAGLLIEVAGRMAESLSRGGRVLVFGNGGSAADAQHLAGELVGRFRKDRRALSAIALTTDPAVVTAVANDFGYERIFARQLEAHGRPGDVAFGISTSGGSPNVIEGFRAAKAAGLVCIGLTGRGGGAVRGLVDVLIDVPHPDTPRIQEVHGMVIHLLCEAVEEICAA